MGLGFACFLWLAAIAWWFWRFDEATRLYHWGMATFALLGSGMVYLAYAVVVRAL